jgi:hypothetical protein
MSLHRSREERKEKIGNRKEERAKRQGIKI